MFPHLIRPAASLSTFLLLGLSPAYAQTAEADKAAELFVALGLPDILEVMREEGVVYGDQIAQDMFPDRVGDDWHGIVESIYDTDRMHTEVSGEFTQALEGQDIDAMLTYFTSDPGQDFVALEVSARRALLDDAVETASKEAAAIAMMDETDRYKLIKEYVETNDLIDTNVVGALNSNYAFYMGLMDGGAFPAELTEEQILTDVWGQEAEIRNNTTEWLYSFLMMAYQPTSDADIESYIAFSETEAGQALNTALFASFDGMFEDVSHKLGFAASRYMQGADL